MKKYLILVLLGSLLFSACDSGKKAAIKEQPSQNANALVKVEKPVYTKDSFPKLDGSTATIPLSQAIAESVIGISKEEAQKFIKHNTTHNAYVNLFNKSADMILVTEPSEEELNMAKQAKVDLDIIPVVREGFVFLVNRENPVDSLTANQVKEIYKGNIKTWKEVGGADKDILAYQREPNSGSQTLMEQVVMKGTKMADAPKTIVTSMEGLIDSVAKYDNSHRALGYSVFYYAKTMYNKDSIKLLKIDGIEPTNESISQGKYPFSTGYYAIVRKDEPKDSAAIKLIAWLTSPEGQRLAEDAGYVSIKER